MRISRRTFLGAASLAPFVAQAATLSEVHVAVLTDEIDEDLAHDAEFLHGFGVKWAELRSVWGKYNTVQPVEKIREARTILDGDPTFGYLPLLYYYQGRVREGLKLAGAADSYRTYLSIRATAGEDPLLADVRKRLAS